MLRLLQHDDGIQQITDHCMNCIDKKMLWQLVSDSNSKWYDYVITIACNSQLLPRSVNDDSTDEVTKSPGSTKRRVKHDHQCEKCSVVYTHWHPPMQRPDHAQFSYQCPNVKCEWFVDSSEESPSREAEEPDCTTLCL